MEIAKISLKYPMRKIVFLSLLFMQIGPDAQCNSDYGFLAMGTTEEDALKSINQICAQPTRSLGVNNESEIYVYFVGKKLQQDDGFKLNYTSGTNVSLCNWSIYYQ